MRLIAVAHAEFGHAERQVAIALDALLENLHMAGAVHRLQADMLRFALAFARRHGDLEHIVAVQIPMAGGLEDAAVDKLRREHFDIAGFVQPAADIVFQRAVKRPAFRMPEHAAGRFVLKMEQIEFLADLAVVALLGFLDIVR